MNRRDFLVSAASCAAVPYLFVDVNKMVPDSDEEYFRRHLFKALHFPPFVSYEVWFRGSIWEGDWHCHPTIFVQHSGPKLPLPLYFVSPHPRRQLEPVWDCDEYFNAYGSFLWEEGSLRDPISETLKQYYAQRAKEPYDHALFEFNIRIWNIRSGPQNNERKGVDYIRYQDWGEKWYNGQPMWTPKSMVKGLIHTF